MELAIPRASLEIRSSTDGNTLVGYASRFNEPIQPYSLWPEFTEIVDPGAFTRTLKEMPDVRALANHDPDKVLGRTTANTLKLTVDSVGLAFECDLPDTQAGRDAKVSIARGDITGCSIGFMVVEEDIVTNRDTDVITRTLLDVDLYEVTLACTFPANPNTEVSLRSAITAQVERSTARPNLELIRLTRRHRRR